MSEECSGMVSETKLSQHKSQISLKDTKSKTLYRGLVLVC